jgi:hypothetical protein
MIGSVAPTPPPQATSLGGGLPSVGGGVQIGVGAGVVVASRSLDDGVALEVVGEMEVDAAVDDEGVLSLVPQPPTSTATARTASVRAQGPAAAGSPITPILRRQNQSVERDAHIGTIAPESPDRG